MKLIKRMFVLGCLLLLLFSWAVYQYPLTVAGRLLFLPSIERLPLSKDTPKTVSKGTSQLLVPENSYVPLKEIPLLLRQAVVAIEDQRFYQHKGVDFYGVGRALMCDITSQAAMEGGSTITQQLARNLFLSQKQTVQRKLSEAFLALQLEAYYHDKNKILELYLNNIYYGRDAWGIGAAAKAYFGISDVSSLTAAQSAFLAGLPQSPSYFADNIASALNKQKIVVEKMKELGYLPDDYVNNPPKVIP